MIATITHLGMAYVKYEGDDYLSPAIWIAIYQPIFVLFFVILPSQKRSVVRLMSKRKRRGERKMDNELLKRYVGKVCNISMGAYGSSYNKARIGELVDNWMKVAMKGAENLINTEYIQAIRILSE